MNHKIVIVLLIALVTLTANKNRASRNSITEIKVEPNSALRYAIQVDSLQGIEYEYICKKYQHAQCNNANNSSPSFAKR